MTISHFGRPSLFYEDRLQLHLQDPPTAVDVADDLNIARYLFKIRCENTALPIRDRVLLETQIPLQLRITSSELDIGIPSATLYLALHPLLTDPILATRSDLLSWPEPRLVHAITASASVIIDHIAQLNENNAIISIWMTIEQVMVAGAVWIAGLLHRKANAGSQLQDSFTTTDVALDPVMKVSTLLASFAARWHPASSYVTLWNAVVESMWQAV